MNVNASSVLSDRMIAELYDRGNIHCDAPLAPQQIQPASLDLRLGTKAFRVRASFLAGHKLLVRDRIDEFGMHAFSLQDGAVLEKGCVYLVELQERLRLAPDLHAVANAKSSSGRIDLFVRVITDGGCGFDRIDAGYAGPLYAEICPLSFSVLVRTGSCLNQIRFCRRRTILSDPELLDLHRRHRLVSGTPILDEGLTLSVDLRLDEGPPGYSAKAHAGIIDIDRVASHPVNQFWDELTVENGRLILEPGQLYILASRESISVPTEYAAEMVPYNPMVGEFRVHYAGFYDPGFGAAETGGTGSRGVLEVRCHDAPFLLEHGQRVGKLVYERMQEAPAKPYGSPRDSSYQGQGLRLSKHFY